MAADASFLQAANSTANASSYTFASQSLGTAAADRYIVAWLWARGNAANFTTPTVTIAGVSATNVFNQIQDLTTSFNLLSAFIAAVPSGTTGDLAVTLNVGALRAAMSMYRLTGIASPTPHDSDLYNSMVAGDPSLSIDVPANGACIAAAFGSAAATTATWTGLAEDADSSVEGQITYTSAHADFATLQTGLAIGVDFASNVMAIAGALSWAPAPAGGSAVPKILLAHGAFFGDGPAA